MDRWSGILRVPLCPNSRTYYKVGVSLCISHTSKILSVPTANAIFFCGDQVGGTGNPVIKKLSDLQNISEILVSKFSNSINAWVIQASVFRGPFAVYDDFIPSVNEWGEPASYNSAGFPASTSTVSLLSSCLEEVKRIISGREKVCLETSCSYHPETFILGFSKGGTILNQLVTELGFSEVGPDGNLSDSEDSKDSGPEKIHIIPATKQSLLNSITEIHYVDVGLNCCRAYLNDSNVIERISKRLAQGAVGVRFVLHGTPRQWCDSKRVWIRNEKDMLVHLLKSEYPNCGGKLQVCERFYFADRPPDMQMHFEIIECLDVS